LGSRAPRHATPAAGVPATPFEFCRRLARPPLNLPWGWVGGNRQRPFADGPPAARDQSNRRLRGPLGDAPDEPRRVRFLLKAWLQRCVCALCTSADLDTFGATQLQGTAGARVHACKGSQLVLGLLRGAKLVQLQSPISNCTLLLHMSHARRGTSRTWCITPDRHTSVCATLTGSRLLG